MLSRALFSWGRLLGLGRTSTVVEEERRTWGRIPCDVETMCRQATAGDQERLRAQVRNVSRGGINLELSRSFQPGELISVLLPGTAAEDTSELLACVVHCAEADACWQLGCTFATPLSDDELLRFGGKRARPVVADQRAWVRFECPAQAVFTRVGAANACPTSAAVVNISASGIALQVTEALSVGDLLSVELRRGNEPPVLTTLASVVRTTAERTGSRIAGCNFIGELSEAQVQLLL